MWIIDLSIDIRQQPLRCRTRLAGQFDATQHPRQLFLALLRIERLHRTLGDAFVRGLAHAVMRMALRRHLRKVGDA